MVDIKSILRKLQGSVFGGAKIPHGMSNPVIRIDDGKPYIAVFAYTYKRENLQTNRLPRPCDWIIADIESGEIINEFSCAKKDFSTAEFNTLYDVSNPAAEKVPTRDDFVKYYENFDELRKKCISGELPTDEIKDYLNTILSITPGNYQRFYKELANL